MLIPKGTYEIRCVLINSETVVNDDGVRELEVHSDEWVVKPSGQTFEIEQVNGGRAILRSNGHRYFAEAQLVGNATVELELKRENVAEILSIEATLTESMIPIDHAASPSW